MEPSEGTKLVLGFTVPRLMVEPFDGVNNFGLWQILVKEVLELRGLIDTLGGKSKKPSNVTDIDWEALESIAVSTIISCLAPDVKCSVMNEKYPQALWKKLENDYALNTLRNRLFRKKKLFRLKMEEGSNIDDHITHFSMLLAELENNKVKIEEEDKVVALLTSLPDSYNNAITNILSGKKKGKIEDVIAHLSESQGLESSRKKCFYCKEKGHIQSQCEKKKKEVPEEENENSLTNVWVFGSGAFHVCSHKDWFDNYTPCGGYIYPHIGDKLEIAGIGDVKVKLYDGNLMTLTGVRHVPTIITNMISVARLNRLGYECITGMTTTVTKNGELVTEGEVMPNGLDKLKGCAVKSKYFREV